MSTETGAATSRSTPPRPERVPHFAILVRRIQNEYREMPGLKLTEAQARRLWDLDRRTCSDVLTTLLERRFLKRTASATYVRAFD